MRDEEIALYGIDGDVVDETLALNNYMTHFFDQLSVTEILSDPEYSRIRGLPFSSPLSDWL